MNKSKYVILNSIDLSIITNNHWDDLPNIISLLYFIKNLADIALFKKQLNEIGFYGESYAECVCMNFDDEVVYFYFDLDLDDVMIDLHEDLTIADLCKMNRLQYHNKIHKKELYTWCDLWELCVTQERYFIVLYKDGKSFAHLQAFEAEEQARDFVKNN